MHYAPNIQQNNAPCMCSLKYSRIQQVKGVDIFELPPCSVDLTSIDTEIDRYLRSIVKRHISRMSNIKDRHFYKLLSNRCTLNPDDLEVRHSAMPKRIQAAITTTGGC